MAFACSATDSRGSWPNVTLPSVFVSRRPSPPLGEALYRHYGLDDVDYETNLLIQDGRAYGRMEAFVHIVSQLGGAWPTVRLILGLPRPMRDWLYDRIAKNRYRLFGRYDACPADRTDAIGERLIG